MVMLAAGCSDGARPSSPAPPAAGGETISGRERFGWNQNAATADELATYRFAVYVDGVRRLLEGETCASAAGPDGFPCSAPLPPLTAGRHTIELAAFVTVDGTVIEGARSEPLHVTVAAATASAGPANAGPLVSSDGLPLDTSIVVRNLDDPVDVAVAPGGQVLVAERGGRIRIVDQTAGESISTLGLPRDAERAELLSIALSPLFADNGWLYLAVLTTNDTQTALRVLRGRAAAGTLAEMAEIASHPVHADTTAVIRFGPDGCLYVGVGAGPEGADAQMLPAFTGKILRLRDDGFTPDGNPWGSPVWSVGHRDPRGLAWDPRDHALWQVERDDAGDEINRVRAGANYGWPLVRAGQAHPDVTRPVFVLPAGIELSGIATVIAPTSPLFGDLIVSAREGQDLLRIRVDGSRRHQATSRLLLGRFGRMGGVASGPDGSLFAVTANGDTWGRGADLLIRVAPAARPANKR